MTDCDVTGTTVYSGDAPAQSFTARRCSFGPLTVGGAAPTVDLSNCTRGALTAGGGVGTMRETRAMGSASFVAVPSVTVPFDPPQPNTAYTVTLEYDGPPAAITDIPVVPAAAKLVTGFDITFGAAQTTTVNYVIHRDF